jgi:hypothetical protein
LVFIRGNIKLEGSDTSFLEKNHRMFNGFQPGIYSYTKDPNYISGVQICWIDSSEKTWGTDFGLSDHSMSNFQIINRINLDSKYGVTGITHGMNIRCAFNCILYDNMGKTMTLQDGKRMSI